MLKNEVTLQAYLGFLSGLRHVQTNKQPVAFEFITRASEQSLTKAKKIAHNYSVHGVLDVTVKTKICAGECRKGREILLRMVEVGIGDVIKG